MGQLPDNIFPSIASLVEVLQEEGALVPEHLQQALEQLQRKVSKALSADEELLEETLEAMFPALWHLRLEALPLLAELELSAVIHKLEFELEAVAKQEPQLKGTVERLDFGLQLMLRFWESMLESSPEQLQKLSIAKKDVALEYHEIINAFKKEGSKEGSEAIALLHGSLMMELLLFSLHQIGNDGPVPDSAMCYELQYLAAEAVKQYASALGVEQTQLPWYHPATSDFQQFLLAGPVANAEELQFVQEKRAHFNTWK